MLIARLAMVVVVWLVGVLLPPPPPAVAQGPPPRLVAHWERPGVARIVWHQPAGVGLTCLWRNGELIRCWPDLPAERYSMLLGNDVYRALLQGVVYLPAFRG